MNIQIPLCNVRHLNGMLNISLENISEKDSLTEKRFKYLGNNNVILEILNGVM